MKPRARIIKLGSLVLLGCGVSVNSAYAIWGFTTTDYPPEVNLSYQFRENVPKQYISSCHVFAATSLIEAACFRNTKNKADISEAYFFNLHLQKGITSWSDLKIEHDLSMLENRAVGHLDAHFKKAFEGNMATEEQYPLVNMKWELDSKVERALFILEALEGTPKKILDPKRRHYSTGSSRQEADSILASLQTYRDAKAKREQLLEMTRETFRQTPSWFFDRESFRRENAAYMRNKAQKRFEAASDELSAKIKEYISPDKDDIVPDQLRRQLLENVGAENLDLSDPKNPKLKSLDPSLSQCLANSRWTWKAYTRFRVLELLNRGIPVVCSGFFTFPTGQSGMHAWTITGYKYDPKNPKDFEYKIRESNLGWTTYKYGCMHIYYIEPKN